jgi:hypothetical protein
MGCGRRDRKKEPTGAPTAGRGEFESPRFYEFSFSLLCGTIRRATVTLPGSSPVGTGGQRGSTGVGAG